MKSEPRVYRQQAICWWRWRQKRRRGKKKVGRSPFRVLLLNCIFLGRLEWWGRGYLRSFIDWSLGFDWERDEVSGILSWDNRGAAIPVWEGYIVRKGRLTTLSLRREHLKLVNSILFGGFHLLTCVGWSFGYRFSVCFLGCLVLRGRCESLVLLWAFKVIPHPL